MKVSIHKSQILKQFPDLEIKAEFLTFNNAEKIDDKRSSSQNSAIHLYCTQLAEAMDELHLDMKLVVKESFRIQPTMQNVKDIIWKNIQYALFHIKSTKQLKKGQKQIDLIHDHIVRHLAENPYTKEVPYIPFPSKEEENKDLKMPDYPQSEGEVRF